MTASLVALAVLPALAGQSGGEPVMPDVEAGAVGLRAVADPLAMAWSGGAYLAHVFSHEGGRSSDAVDPPFLFDTSADPFVGNGRALAWTFAYAAPEHEGKLYFVSVGGDEKVLYAHELTDPWHGCCMVSPYGYSGESSTSGPAPVNFSLDAEDAFAAVADRPEFREFPAAHPVYTASSRLVGVSQNQTVWYVMLRTASYYAAHAAVDAQTGEVLQVDAWPRSPQWEPPCCGEEPTPPSWPAPEDYHESYEGTMGPTTGWFEIHIPVESAAHAQELRVVADVEGALSGVDHFRLRILDPNWQELASAEGTGSFELSVNSFPTEGPYFAVLEPTRPLVHEVGVTMDVTILYADEPRAPEPLLPARFTGYAGAWGMEGHHFLYVDMEDLGPVTLTLSWNRTLPSQNLEILVLDENYNPMASARGETVEAGASTLTLTVDLEGRCCADVVVRAPFPGLLETAYVLVVEEAPATA